MHVLIGAFGTRGDVQPMLALAQGLKRRGHSARLVVSPEQVPLARSFGFDAAGVGMDYDALARQVVDGGFSSFASLMPLMRDQVVAQLEGLEPFAAQADVIVGSSVFVVGSVLADRLRKPFSLFAFFPQVFPSGEHPTPMTRWRRWPPAINRFAWRVHKLMWDRILRDILNAVRRERGLAPIARVWPAVIGRHPVAAWSPLMSPVPADLELAVHQVGALFAEENAELSPELSQFLAEGPAPVFVGFGSMPDRRPRRTSERILAAVRSAGVRAVVQVGAAGLENVAPGPDVLFVGPEPHGKLFPRCAAAVHHGGAGTSHRAARAGVPQIVMPHMMDQPFWADRLHRLGASPRPVSRNSAEVGPLAHALRSCLEDTSMQARAQAVSRQIGSDGVERAVDYVESLVAQQDIARQVTA